MFYTIIHILPFAVSAVAQQLFSVTLKLVANYHDLILPKYHDLCKYYKLSSIPSLHHPICYFHVNIQFRYLANQNYKIIFFIRRLTNDVDSTYESPSTFSELLAHGPKFTIGGRQEELNIRKLINNCSHATIFRSTLKRSTVFLLVFQYYESRSCDVELVHQVVLCEGPILNSNWVITCDQAVNPFYP